MWNVTKTCFVSTWNRSKRDSDRISIVSTSTGRSCCSQSCRKLWRRRRTAGKRTWMRSGSMRVFWWSIYVCQEYVCLPMSDTRCFSVEEKGKETTLQELLWHLSGLLRSHVHQETKVTCLSSRRVKILCVAAGCLAEHLADVSSDE